MTIGSVIALVVVASGLGLNSAKPASAQDYKTQGEQLCRDRQPYDARKALDQATARAKGLDASDPRLPSALNERANALVASGRYGEAESQYRRALKILGAAQEPDQKQIVGVLTNLARLLHAQARLEEADGAIGEALVIAEKVHGTTHPAVARVLRTQSAIVFAMGRTAEAEAMERRGLVIHEQVFGPNHPAVADSLDGLAYYLMKRGRYREAEPFAERALQIFESNCRPDQPIVQLTRERVLRIQYQKAKQSLLDLLWLLAGLPVLIIVWIALRKRRARRQSARLLNGPQS